MTSAQASIGVFKRLQSVAVNLGGRKEEVVRWSPKEACRYIEHHSPDDGWVISWEGGFDWTLRILDRGFCDIKVHGNGYFAEPVNGYQLAFYND